MTSDDSEKLGDITHNASESDGEFYPVIDSASKTENTDHVEVESNDESESETDANGNIGNEDFSDSDLDGDETSRTEEEEATIFKDGQLLQFVAVRFPGNSKPFPFYIGNKKIPYGERVVAMNDRGVDIGFVNSFPYTKKYSKLMDPIRHIQKIAGAEDLAREREWQRKELEAKFYCESLIQQLKLNMELTHVKYTQFGKKAVVYFTAPDRVDFRELVKDLVGKLKVRIEMRQIYIRDRTAAVGGIGPCGQQLCCSSFLTKYGHVNIRMAKNQNLTLSPNRLNGVCGQLKCCLQYEDNVYTDKRKKLPTRGSFIQTTTGERGKVEDIDIIKEIFQMLTDKGIRKKFTSAYFDKKEKLPDTWSFPDGFDFITDETQVVVGKETVDKNARQQDEEFPFEIFREQEKKLKLANEGPSEAESAKASDLEKSGEEDSDTAHDADRSDDKFSDRESEDAASADDSDEGEKRTDEENSAGAEAGANKNKSRHRQRNRNRNRNRNRRPPDSAQ
jgi:cell fate regulator YaaT (PSP1 superfamily)